MSATLERRYRRLLRCYPPGHRAAYREEMLGILLATARPGQRAPGVRQTLNLVTCGLATRGHRALVAGPSQDALAVASLIVPVVMLVLAVLDFGVTVREAVLIDRVDAPTAPFWGHNLVSQLAGPAVVLISWLAVLLLGLASRRRAAAAVASVPLALGLADLLAEIMLGTGVWPGALPEFVYGAGAGHVFVTSLAACSLAFSPGPRRGLAIVGRWRTCLIVACLSAASGFVSILTLVSPDRQQMSGLTLSLLNVLAVAIALAVTYALSVAAGRVAVLVAIGFVPGLVSNILLPFPVDMTVIVAFLLGGLLSALLVWPVAIASWKRAAHSTRPQHDFPLSYEQL
jgi:hypothetical protein